MKFKLVNKKFSLGKCNSYIESVGVGLLGFMIFIFIIPICIIASIGFIISGIFGLIKEKTND
jgi:hypothetical protein